MINWILLSFKPVEALGRKSTHILSVAANLNGLGRRSWLTFFRGEAKKIYGSFTRFCKSAVASSNRDSLVVEHGVLRPSTPDDPSHATRFVDYSFRPASRIFFQFYCSCTISYVEQTILRYIKRLFSHLTDDTTNKI